MAGMVGALTDDEAIDSYRERKAEHRERVAAADGEALAIYGADKLTNVKALRAAYEDEGDAVREEFKVPIELKTEIWEADLRPAAREGAGAALPRRARRGAQSSSGSPRGSCPAASLKRRCSGSANQKKPKTRTAMPPSSRSSRWCRRGRR